MILWERALLSVQQSMKVGDNLPQKLNSFLWEHLFWNWDSFHLFLYQMCPCLSLKDRYWLNSYCCDLFKDQWRETEVLELFLWPTNQKEIDEHTESICNTTSWVNFHSCHWGVVTLWMLVKVSLIPILLFPLQCAWSRLSEKCYLGFDGRLCTIFNCLHCTVCP